MASDPKDLKLPTTTKEFAIYLRDIADQIDRIPDQPMLVDESDVEVGFFYGNIAFPQKPTGLHFEVNVTTAYRSSATRRVRP